MCSQIENNFFTRPKYIFIYNKIIIMTSIEWLIEELKKVHHPTEAMIMYAKKLEKEQLADAWYAGDEDGPIHEFEDYYAETYGSKGSDEMSDEEIEEWGME
jgi:hypothetical protein